MSRQYSVAAASAGFSVKAYAGDRCEMLPSDLADHQCERPPGFSIARRCAGQQAFSFLGNRLGFSGVDTHPDAAGTSSPTVAAVKFQSSDSAPFQKFWWLDFPPDADFGPCDYQLTVKRFKSAASTDLVDDQRVSLRIDVQPFAEGAIELAFTRGYLSSQAYADRFGNGAYQPGGHLDGWRFDTTGYQAQWAWLGGHARQAVIDFFIDCRDTPGATMDALVYDLNEPDIINAFITLGPRLRLLADDSKTHASSTAAGKAFADIAAVAAVAQQGHFSRFQHNKVLIKRVNGQAVKVLTGSTNFSITGLYVNANHVLVFNDAQVAGHYGDAFDAALAAGLKTGAFAADGIAKQTFAVTEAQLPALGLSFAPHTAPTFSLQPLLQAIQQARSSVIFAVMDLDGKSAVLSALKALHASKTLFSYGISDSPDASGFGNAGAAGNTTAGASTTPGTAVFTPSADGGVLVYSKENPEQFPPPFTQEREVTSAAAHVVHHKFVVVDFNGSDPVVFCGSSNLAEGGEQSNGDNLIAMHDRAIATAFAIEGIRLVDHYAFAAALKHSSGSPQPLRLKTDAEGWWKPYYQAGSIKQTERQLFSR